MTETESAPDITPRWLKTKDAVKYSSIGRDRLKMLATRGVIRGAPDPDNKRGDWVFDRFSIDQYRVGQVDCVPPREKALEILKTIKI